MGDEDECYFELSEFEEIVHHHDALVFVSNDFRSFFPVEEIVHLLLFALLVDLLPLALQIGIERSFHFELRPFHVNLRRTNLRLVQQIDAQTNRFRLQKRKRDVCLFSLGRGVPSLERTDSARRLSVDCVRRDRDESSSAEDRRDRER